MEVKEAKDRKKALEALIATEVVAFEMATGARVEQINLDIRIATDHRGQVRDRILVACHVDAEI